MSHPYPEATDPEFWAKFSRLIDAEIDVYRHHLKTWWLVHRLPFWYPQLTHLQLHFLLAVQQHYDQCTEAERQRLAVALAEPFRGHTRESHADALVDFGRDGIFTSGWSLKDAYHVLSAERYLQRPITDYKYIVEIGGGIGEQARYIRDLGYTAPYMIYDLEATAKISRAYLGTDYNVTITTNINDVRAVCTTVAPEDVLVIGTWSLSEMPLTQRVEVCRALAGADWYIIFQAYIFAMNNIPFFVNHFKGLTRSTHMLIDPIPFDQYQGGGYHCIASSRS